MYLANARTPDTACAAASVGCARTDDPRPIRHPSQLWQHQRHYQPHANMCSSSSTLHWHVLKCTRALTFHDTDKQNTPVQHQRSPFTCKPGADGSVGPDMHKSINISWHVTQTKHTCAISVRSVHFLSKSSSLLKRIPLGSKGAHHASGLPVRHALPSVPSLFSRPATPKGGALPSMTEDPQCVRCIGAVAW